MAAIFTRSLFACLFLLCSATLSVQATPGHRPAYLVEMETGNPERIDLRQEARLTSAYLTEVLHLNGRQTIVIQRYTYDYLSQLDVLLDSEAPEQSLTALEQQYTAALGRVFTGGQYSNYLWLTASSPIASKN